MLYLYPNMDNQMGFNMKGEINPVVENISFDSTFIDDQGDIFHCGKCKSNFNSFFEFISHKKEHASQAIERPPSHIVVQNDLNIVTMDEKPNQIWVWNPGSTAADTGEIIVSSQLINDHTNVPSDVTIEYKPISNFHDLDQNCVASDCNEIEITNENLHLNLNGEMKAGNKAEKSLLTCSICQREFKKQFSFFLHLRSHSGEKPFQCVICGRTFPQKSNVKKHMLTHRVWPNGLGKTVPEKAAGNDLGYSCKFCSTILKTHPELKIHLKIHGHQKVYKCIQNKCKEMYVDVDSLMSHVKTSHETVEYHCHMCSAVLNSLDDMSTHQQEHLRSKTQLKSASKYRCVLCNKVFKKHEDLTYHLATADHVNKCSHCQKSFSTERALRRHLIVHDVNKSFKCDVCGLAFRKKQYLLSHQTTHSKERSFICSVCNSKFNRKDMLVRHIKIHQTNKRLQCPFRSHLGCTMEFTRSDKLNLHIKSHTKKIDGKRKNEKTKNKKRKSEQPSTMEIIIVPLPTDQCSAAVDANENTLIKES